jgi:hypothetical protein
VDVTIPSVARIYDYMLGGKDNFAADREAAGTILRLIPDAQQMARDNRDFLVRSVRFLAEAGVEQFIDLGTGIPTSPNVHEVARKVVPAARVVYVDHDPVVFAHSRALLATDDGVIAVRADLREPAEVLGDPAVTRLIDFSQPVAVLILSVLHFVSDEEDPYQIVAGYRDRMASGSYLAITAGSAGGVDEATAKAAAELYRSAGTPVRARSGEQMMKFFAGCDLVDPGLVNVAQWRSDPGTDATPTAIQMLAGVGRKR